MKTTLLIPKSTWRKVKFFCKHWFTSSVWNCRWVAEVPPRETSPSGDDGDERVDLPTSRAQNFSPAEPERRSEGLWESQMSEEKRFFSQAIQSEAGRILQTLERTQAPHAGWCEERFLKFSFSSQTFAAYLPSSCLYPTVEATYGSKNVPKRRTLRKRQKNGVFLKKATQTRNSVPKWMSTHSTTTEFYCKAYQNLPLTFLHIAHPSNIFYIGSAYIQSVDWCLKRFFKKTWTFQFNMESFQFINLISMSLLFKQWLGPGVNQSLTSVTKTTVFFRNFCEIIEFSVYT